VHEGTESSNACLKAWFDTDHSIRALLAKKDAEKINGRIRIAFQRSEAPAGPCVRSFEDAFMLANEAKFGGPAEHI
jgi:putative ATP-dependent endonuclease of OLD family